MDRETVEKVKMELEKIAVEEEIELDKILFFGSRVRGDYTEKSDIDVIIVSEDFKGTPWYRRGGEFQRRYSYNKLPTLELICLTPEEFEGRKKKLGDVVHKAVDEGITI